MSTNNLQTGLEEIQTARDTLQTTVNTIIETSSTDIRELVALTAKVMGKPVWEGLDLTDKILFMLVESADGSAEYNTTLLSECEEWCPLIMGFGPPGSQEKVFISGSLGNVIVSTTTASGTSILLTDTDGNTIADKYPLLADAGGIYLYPYIEGSLIGVIQAVDDTCPLMKYVAVFE